MPDNQTKKEFIRDLEKDAWEDYVAGRRHNLTDTFITVVIVIASLAATILAATSNVYPWLIAAVAAIPAACTSLQRIIGFRERSDWYFLHADKLRELLFELKYAKAPDLEDFGRRRAKIEVEVGAQWRQRNKLVYKTKDDI